MNNKIKGFMENVGFVSFVLTCPKLFQPFQLHKSNWAYMVNTKFTSKKRNLASLQAVYVSRQMLCNRPFHSCGLSILAFEWTWGWGLVLIQTFFLFLWKLYSKIVVSIEQHDLRNEARRVVSKQGQLQPRSEF